MTNSLEDKQRGAEANRQAALPRDEKILALLADGKTWLEVAEAMNIKPSSVGTAITRARRRAGIQPRPYRT